MNKKTSVSITHK